jgi:DNA-binding beta-propeller fold protein YncE
VPVSAKIRHPLRRLVPLALLPLLGAPAGAAPAAPAAVATQPYVFGAPSGERQAGPLDARDPYTQVLPSGRLVHPTGTSVVVGMNALGVGLSPDGRFAIVSNDTDKQGAAVTAVDGVTRGGYSLAVVDTASMKVVDRYAPRGEAFFMGVVALRDPADEKKTLVLAAGGGDKAVYAMDLDASGLLTPDAHHVIALPGATDPHFGNNGLGFASTIVLSPDHARAYVVDELANDVAVIDVKSRTLAGPQMPVGFFPLGAALTNFGLLVANEGLQQYPRFTAPSSAPRFAAPSEDIQRASSLALVGLDKQGLAQRLNAWIPMDPRPDGVRAVGGAHPDAIVAMRHAPYAFVALAGVDRVAVVALGGVQPRVVGGTELRLFDRGPYGTQPSALALAEGQKRLYVALAGIDAVAVLDISDPVHPHRLGLIPTGWYPSALILSADGKRLFVANAKGFSHDPGFRGAVPEERDARGRVLKVDQDSNVIWATLQRIDLQGLDLRRQTAAALSYLRTVKRAEPNPVVPQGVVEPSPTIKHVVLILQENKTYDSMLGDLTDAAGHPYGPGDPALVSFDKTVTPNLHALAATFGLAGNFYADAEESDAGHQFVSGGIASLYTERTLTVKKKREPMVNKNEDVEDYPRAGYIFNAMDRAGKTYRDYGDLLRLSGYDDGENPDPKVDDPNFAGIDDQDAPLTGLGGRYSLDVPAPLALGGHIDPNYPAWNLRIRDVRRAKEFIKDFDAYVKAGTMPAYTTIFLPACHGGHGPFIPPLAEEVADGDRALGTIVDYLTHSPEWSSTAIFIEPDDAQSGYDHVNEHRSYAVVVSPLVKRHYLGMRHLSTASVLKTEEELLGVVPLSLGDVLATDFGDFFTSSPDATPYTRIDVPKQTASVEGERIAALLDRTDQSGPDADADRAGRLVTLSREADALAVRRATLPAGDYAARQDALYRRALAVVSGSPAGTNER